MTKRFVITCRGLSASRWLATSLSRVPGVFCSHGRDRPVRSLEDPNSLVQQKEYRLDRLTYELAQRHINPRLFLSDTNTGSATSTAHSYCGNVHGYTLPEVCKSPELFDEQGIRLVGNLIRSPLAFILSYSAMYIQNYYTYPEKFFAEHYPRLLQNNDSRVNIRSEVGNELAIGALAEAFYACSAVFRDVFEYREVNIIRMEDLTTSEDYLISFFKSVLTEISKEDLECHARTAIRNKGINTHLGISQQLHFPPLVSHFEFNIRTLTAWPSSLRHDVVRLLSPYQACIEQFYPDDPIVQMISQGRD